jgi:hypothetical protein
MSILQVLIIAAVVVFVIVRRFAGSPVQARSLVLPLGVTAYGVVMLRHAHVGTVDVAFLAVEVLLALAVGALRGTTIRLYVRDGYLWQRYQWSTLAAWVAAIALRVGLSVVGQLAGVHLVTQSLLLVLGLSLVAEALVVGRRALRHGAPTVAGRRTVRV